LNSYHRQSDAAVDNAWNNDLAASVDFRLAAVVVARTDDGVVTDCDVAVIEVARYQALLSSAASTGRAVVYGTVVAEDGFEPPTRGL
jgi:hypothetical protein